MNRSAIFLIFVILIGLSACASREKFVYLNDMQEGVKYPFDSTYEAVVHRNDRLAITVSCKNQELAVPFNIQGGNFRLDESGNVIPADMMRSREKGYRVDVRGDIDFPILGRIHVEGLTLSQLKELIADKIKDGNYIKDPLVSIEFLNFKYTVLGAVGSNGSFSVEGDRITLIEAIANAGDLTSKARVDRVIVIRENGGQRQMYVNDLRSTELFNSPSFYLQQNDIVYVEPKYRKKDRGDLTWQLTTFFISLVSVACSIIYAIK